MAVLTPPLNLMVLQQSNLTTGQHQFSICSTVRCCNALSTNYLSTFTSAKKPSISCNSILQNCNRLEFEDTQFRKLGVKPGFLKNRSVIDVSVVNKKIKEYVDDGLFEKAIGVYIEMMSYGLPVEEFSYFPCLIKAFGGLLDLRKGRQIHGHVLKFGVSTDTYVANSLLSLYWKCGAIDDVLYLFEKMPERDLISWNTMISGFDQSMCPMESIMMFNRMIREFCEKPNRVACVSVLSSCALLGLLIQGQEIHTFIIKNGLEHDPLVANGLIRMYTKCGDLRNAERIFRSVLKREALKENTMIWNVMVSGYVNSGCLLKALMLFCKMLVVGIEPDSSTMVAVLVLCSQLQDLEFGRQIHGYIFSFGLENDIRVNTTLLDMYCKCGDMEAGLKILEKSSNQNIIMWGAIIAGCIQNGCPTKALELSTKFRLEGGFTDSVTVLAVLRACSSLTLKLEGMEAHGLSVKMGFDSDAFVGGALTDMYAKCGDLESAQKVLLRLPERDVISWNALVSGCVQNDCADEALKAFHNMQAEHVKPNAVTFACILTVSANLSVLILCKQIHCYLIRNRFEPNVLVSNSLIATYARCGDINSAYCVFKEMPERNEISWNSIISGLGMHGHMDDVFTLLDEMKATGVKPDSITFTAILSACSHAGRVDDGWKHFRSMVEDYDLKPELEQYTCMVDLLGRAGHLEQAYDLIMDMPCQPDARIWGSLLGSCKIHGYEELAERAAHHLFGLDSSSTGYHVLLSNIYEDFGKFDDVTRIRATMKEMGLKKRPGCSWIEVNNKIHIFIAGDQSHNQNDGIYAALGNLTVMIKEAGYIP